MHKIDFKLVAPLIVALLVLVLVLPAFSGAGAGQSVSSGQLKWSHAAGGGVYLLDVAGNVVYLASGDGNLYAFSAKDGTTLWSYQTGARIYSNVVVAGNVVYFRNYVTDGNVYAVSKQAPYYRHREVFAL